MLCGLNYGIYQIVYILHVALDMIKVDQDQPVGIAGQGQV